jgi:hypothetical protein
MASQQKERRRRSFDGGLASHHQSTTATKPLPSSGVLLAPPTPILSVSARVTTTTTSPIPTNNRPTPQPLSGSGVIGGRGGINVPKINTTSVPFPRGGRQIGASSSSTAGERGGEGQLKRSSSIERRGGPIVVEGKQIGGGEGEKKKKRN